MLPFTVTSWKSFGNCLDDRCTLENRHSPEKLEVLTAARFRSFAMLRDVECQGVADVSVANINTAVRT
jgi:hypothetical protein